MIQISKQLLFPTVVACLVLYCGLLDNFHSRIEANDSLWVIHSGFQQLRRGSAGDSGANLYISAKGRIQTINRWDLNVDGELDLFFTQDHNNVYTPDTLIYWGSETGYQSLLPDMWWLRAPFSLLKAIENSSKHITRLPTSGGGRSRIADLNLDGFLDIVICNFQHNYRTDQPAYIYWGGPDGFQSTNRTDLPAYLASGVAVGDLNKDGLPDVVLANRGSERGESIGFRKHLESYIYWGNLNGFNAKQRTSIPTISAVDVSMGDFNGDKHPDLAFLNYNSQEQSLYIYWGNGQGDFAQNRRQVLSQDDLKTDNRPPRSDNIEEGMTTLLTLRANSDKLSDLAVAGSRNAILYYGSPEGLQLMSAVILPANNCLGMAAADLNQDGRLDLILANSGTRKAPLVDSTIFWATEQGFNPKRRSTLPTQGARTVQAADLNGDSFVDILFGNSRDSQGSDVPSYIYWGGSRGFSPHRRKELTGFGVISSGIADFNRDDQPDLLLVSNNSGKNILPAVIYWGTPDQYYSMARTSLIDLDATMEYSIADLDDDNYPDIVVIRGDKSVVVWGSPSGYHKGNDTELPVTPALGTSIADLNQDGFLDIVVSLHGTPRRKAQAAIVWGNSARFDNAKTTQWELAGHAIEANAIADLNRDSFLDLIFPESGSTESEVFWGGPQGFGRHNVLRLKTNAPHVVPADLDNNGWLDLIFTSGFSVREYTANSNTLIYWGSSQGFSDNNTVELEGFTTLDATVSDFNRDGHLDIATTNYRSDTTRELPAFIYWGNSDNIFSEKRRTLLDAHSSSAIDSLDLNRDGWVDLIISNHQINFDHAAGTNIYWGGELGFSNKRRHHIPTVGVHLDAMVDAGNIYNRRYEWSYISPAIKAPYDSRFAALYWKAQIPSGTTLKFQIRSAKTQKELQQLPWSGSSGPNSFYKESGSTLSNLKKNDRWLQYQAIFGSQDAGNSALLTEISIQCKR